MKDKPELILDLKSTILANAEAAQTAADAEAITAAADNLQYKPEKNFAYPLLWSYGAPLFTATGVALVKLQAATAIPWMSFIVLAAVAVRVSILPLMIRQMTLINKMS